MVKLRENLGESGLNNACTSMYVDRANKTRILGPNLICNFENFRQSCSSMQHAACTKREGVGAGLCHGSDQRLHGLLNRVGDD